MKSHFDSLAQLITEKVIAIVRLDSGEQLIKVTEALQAGGITAIEFTLSTPGALNMIRESATRFGKEILLGAGTVLDPETARAAILAGAMTPTEILKVWQAGADLVKVFPAINLGGPDYIKAVLAPLPQLRLVPTGGVSADNAAQYLKAGAVAVAVGGNLVKKKDVAGGDWEAITFEARRLLAVVRTKSWISSANQI